MVPGLHRDLAQDRAAGPRRVELQLLQSKSGIGTVTDLDDGQARKRELEEVEAARLRRPRLAAARAADVARPHVSDGRVLPVLAGVLVAAAGPVIPGGEADQPPVLPRGLGP